MLIGVHLGAGAGILLLDLEAGEGVQNSLLGLTFLYL